MPGGLFWKGQNRRQRDGPRGFCNTLKKKGADSVTHRQGSGHWRNAKGKERRKLGDWLAKEKKDGERL